MNALPYPAWHMSVPRWCGTPVRLNNALLFLLLLLLLLHTMNQSTGGTYPVATKQAEPSQTLSFEKQMVAALDAAGVPVDEAAEGAAESAGVVAPTGATVADDEAAAVADADEPKKSGGVFGYLFGGGGARDEEGEAAPADGEQ